MPEIQKHMQLSEARTGKSFKTLHEWMNCPKHNSTRHDIINILKTLKHVKRKFGKGSEKEFLYHIKDDYEKNRAWQIIRTLAFIKKIMLFPLRIFKIILKK